MGDYQAWRYSSGEQARRAPPSASLAPQKRPRREYDDVPPARTPSYRGGAPPPSYGRERSYDDRGGRPGYNGMDDVGDLPPYGGDVSLGPIGGLPGGRELIDDRLIAPRGPPLDPVEMRGRGPGLNGAGLPEPDLDILPLDASPTLFVDGLPTDCTRREAAHIFRPFIGFKEVRLVPKDAKRAPGEKVMLCFVEFADARCSATALDALQGYKFDYADPNSFELRLSFARQPGPRSAIDRGLDRGLDRGMDRMARDDRYRRDYSSSYSRGPPMRR